MEGQFDRQSDLCGPEPRVRERECLWNSQAFNIQFLFNKFDPPVIDGGQIYVPNYNGGVDLYRLVQ
jgi:hypothetical protein